MGQTAFEISSSLRKASSFKENLLGASAGFDLEAMRAIQSIASICSSKVSKITRRSRHSAMGEFPFTSTSRTGCWKQWRMRIAPPTPQRAFCRQLAKYVICDLCSKNEIGMMPIVLGLPSLSFSKRSSEASRLLLSSMASLSPDFSWRLSSDKARRPDLPHSCPSANWSLPRVVGSSLTTTFFCLFQNFTKLARSWGFVSYFDCASFHFRQIEFDSQHFSFVFEMLQLVFAVLKTQNDQKD